MEFINIGQRGGGHLHYIHYCQLFCIFSDRKQNPFPQHIFPDLPVAKKCTEKINITCTIDIQYCTFTG